MWLCYNASLVLLGYTALWAPMEADHYDFLAVFNEAVLCISIYAQLLFTDYVPTPEQRYFFAEILLVILYVDFGTNLLLLAFEIVRILCRSLR